MKAVLMTDLFQVSNHHLKHSIIDTFHSCHDFISCSKNPIQSIFSVLAEVCCYVFSPTFQSYFFHFNSFHPFFQSLLMFAAVFSVAGCSLWDAGLKEIIDTADRTGIHAEINVIFTEESCYLIFQPFQCIDFNQVDSSSLRHHLTQQSVTLSGPR